MKYNSNNDNTRDNFIAHIIWKIQQCRPFIFGNRAEQNKNQRMLIKELGNLTHVVQPTGEHSILHLVSCSWLNRP